MRLLRTGDRLVRKHLPVLRLRLCPKAASAAPTSGERLPSRLETAGAFTVVSGFLVVLMAVLLTGSLAICPLTAVPLGLAAMVGGYVGTRRRQRNMLLAAGVCATSGSASARSLLGLG